MSKEKSRFGNVNPADPFGLVAKKAAGVDIDRAYEVVRLRNSATGESQKVSSISSIPKASADAGSEATRANPSTLSPISSTTPEPSSEPVKPEVQTTVLDNDLDFVEVVRERSPLVQRYPTTRVEREETRPAPGFSCAYWSNGLLELRRGEWIIATLTAAEAEYVREFLGKAAA